MKYNEKHLRILGKWLFINIILGLLFYFLLRSHITVTSESDINISDNLNIYNYLTIAQFPSSCFMSAGFIFIYGLFKSKWKMRLLWFSFLISVVAALLLGRRTSALIPIMFLIAKIFYDLYYRPQILIPILFIIIIVYYGSFYIIDQFSSIFIILEERAFDNTRYWVEYDFYKDMQGWDYIFGRGSEGQVYSSEYGKRPIIETGYLNMILHGGIIYLFLYLYLLTVSALRALFSKNKMLISMSLFIFIMIVCLYPAGHLSFAMGTAALWASVSCCSNLKFKKNKFNIEF